MNLPNFRQSPSFAAILRDLSTWSVADINRAGRSKTVRNTYESIQMNFTFNSRGKIWNCSLNLPFLHPHATISSNNSNTTTSVRIPLVDSTVRNNLCHPSFDSNVKCESNNITASSSRQYQAFKFCPLNWSEVHLKTFICISDGFRSTCLIYICDASCWQVPQNGGQTWRLPKIR